MHLSYVYLIVYIEHIALMLNYFLQLLGARPRTSLMYFQLQTISGCPKIFWSPSLIVP